MRFVGMRENLRFSAMLVASSLASLPVSVSAHHSMAEFDRSTVTEVEGEVVSIS